MARPLPVLRLVGRNRCGLDIDGNGPRNIEVQQLHINYFACALVLRHRHTFEVSRRMIRFDDRNGKTWSLPDWQTAIGKRPDEMTSSLPVLP